MPLGPGAPRAAAHQYVAGSSNIHCMVGWMCHTMRLYDALPPVEVTKGLGLSQSRPGAAAAAGALTRRRARRAAPAGPRGAGGAKSRKKMRFQDSAAPCSSTNLAAGAGDACMGARMGNGAAAWGRRGGRAPRPPHAGGARGTLPARRLLL
jgi:hypothetical protein